MTRRAVFFDFADTLFSSRSLRDAHLHQLRFVSNAVGAHPTDEELRGSYRQGMGASYRSIATRPYYLHRELFGAAFVGMAESLGGALDDDQVREAVDRQYAATLDGAELRPDCLDTLRRLQAGGVHVQIVSNIDEEQLTGLVERLELAPVIDAATSSEAARSCKPDPGIYEFALEKARCAPAEVLFVGDSSVHDVVGPQSLGMSTALLVADDARRGSDDCSPDFVIERLGQVADIVEHERVR